MNSRGGLIACLILIAGLARFDSPAYAESASPQLDLSQLMSRFSAIKSASARFTERRYLHVLKTPLDDTGVLVYEAPDKLQKQTLLPNQQNMVVEGDTLIIQSEGKTRTLNLADYPQIGAFIEGIRATLAGDSATLQRIYATQLSGSMDAWVLKLTPREEAMRAIVSSITISGSGGRIRQVVTAEHDGDRTDMTILEGAQ
jgi:outer membrane lipoprotein-sorting protein